ncbi:MAG: TIGR00159 family protein [Blastocatellia bacterium]|nr:MAG: TIGR00159 family protein [Blastocatellia bacterium]
MMQRQYDRQISEAGERETRHIVEVQDIYHQSGIVHGPGKVIDILQFGPNRISDRPFAACVPPFDCAGQSRIAVRVNRDLMTTCVEPAREIGNEELGSSVPRWRDGDEGRSDESDAHDIDPAARMTPQKTRLLILRLRELFISTGGTPGESRCAHVALGIIIDMTAIRWQSAADVVVLAVAIYLLLRWSREARALRLAMSILALRVAALIARQLDLLITSWVLDATTIVALLVLVIAFQPELRRAVMRMDLFGRTSPERQLPVWAAVASAAGSLAEDRCGALIVFVQDDSIAELVTGGVTLSSRVSPELLQAIFQKSSPIHDGAVVIEGDQLVRARVFLPLTQRSAPEHYGTRHRAALGLTERSDAIVVVVSEERGEITFMREGRADPVPNQEALLAILRTIAPVDSDRPRRARRAQRTAELGIGIAALALSVAIWTVTFLLPGRSVRMQTVPVEFSNVPPGLTIASQSADSVHVWVRASDFVFDSLNLGGLVARCNLAAAHEGLNVVRLDASAVDVPPGIKLEGWTPHELQVRLTPSSAGTP